MRLARVSFPVRLALTYTLFFALVLALLTTGLLLAARQVLRDELQRHLQASADLINADFDSSNAPLQAFFDSPEFLLRALPPSVAGLDAPGLYAEAVAPNGVVVATSASLEGRTIPLTPELRAAALAGQATIVEARVNETPALMIVHPLTDDTHPRGVLLVARLTGEADRTLGLLAWSLAAVSLAALAAAATGGAWLTSLALRPVDEIARTARQIVHASDLARRVPEARGGPLAQLTGTVNELLGRLEQLFTAQQRFVADVSHELRTPLAAMRSTLEVLRRGAAQDPAMLAESLADLEGEAHRLGRMASDLLLLAQADLGAHLARRPVALDELVLEVARDMRSLAGEVRLIPSFAEQVEVDGDHDRLKQALINLVMNALQHTPPGGSVSVALERAGGEALVRVRDTGSGIPAAALPHLFERFYRVESDRSRATGGAGLGLAIVEWVVLAHGGRVSVESAVGAGSTFTLHIPLAPEPAPEPRGAPAGA